MNLFDVCALSHILHDITTSQMTFALPKTLGQGNQPITEIQKQRAERAMELADKFFTIVEMPDCLQAVRTAKTQWNRPMLDSSAANEITYRLGLDLVNALQNRQFLRVADDRSNLLLHARGDEPNFGVVEVFGDSVGASFPSAARDIEEAGNCLAAECNTAAVFHLMRAAEVALRAIAIDRQVAFASKPIDQQEWGTILGALEGRLKELRLDDGKNWASLEFKDTQIQFYNETVQELRGFNEAWRRYLSHADPQAFYDHDDAAGVFKHVKKFMQKLAPKIGEATTTPKYWTANEAK
jgi:hypothetical protein